MWIQMVKRPMTSRDPENQLLNTQYLENS